jgi:hypothetical protein
MVLIRVNLVMLGVILFLFTSFDFDQYSWEVSYSACRFLENTLVFVVVKLVCMITASFWIDMYGIFQILFPEQVLFSTF